MFTTNFNVKMNGVRDTFLASSDQTLAALFAERNIPYEGIDITANGVKLQDGDFDRPFGEVFAERFPNAPEPDSVFLVSIKRQDGAR